MPFSTDRIFYACIGVFYNEKQTTKTGGDTSFTSGEWLGGVQSIGVDSSFPRSSYLDVGRFQKKYGSYDKQEFSITIERVIDKAGEFFYSTSASTDYEATHLLNPANVGYAGFENSLRNYDIILVYAPDQFDRLGGDGSNNEFAATQYRCCLLTGINYSIGVDGEVKESLTFTTRTANQINTGSTNWSAMDIPGVNESADLIKRNDIDTTNSTLPTEVTRMFDLSTSKDGIPVYGLQTIEIGATINYSDILDAGQWRGSNLNGSAWSETFVGKTITETVGSTAKRAEQNLYRQVLLPVEVTASFTGVARKQYGTGSQAFELTNDTFSDNAEILIATKTGIFQWNLGQKNYLTGINYTGGDSGGGNVEATLSFQNDFSDFVLIKSASIQTIASSSSTF